jgi:DeoR/GlpR family transcriptional regulator of sugar metabolism
MTVRRDLAQLDGEGLLRRVHGGALPVRAAEAPPAAATPRQRLADTGCSAATSALGCYEALATAAVGHLAPGSCVGLAAGPLAAVLAEALSDIPDLVVVTNSLPAADVLESAGGVSVILTGGVRTTSGALVGPIAVAALGSLHLGEVLLAADAIDHRAGITAPNLLEAEVQRAMMRAAPAVRVVVPGHRVGSVALCAVAPASAVQTVVTDADASASGPVAALARVVEVVTVARPDPQRRTA